VTLGKLFEVLQIEGQVPQQAIIAPDYTILRYGYY
jgi:hypothetical protein